MPVRPAKSARDLFNPTAPEQAKLGLSDAPIEQQFVEKYAPQSFDEIVGQDAIVAALRSFVARPYTTAFLFHGDTGAGKTSTAKALANELGIDRAANYHFVGSGTANAETVESILDGFRVTPWGGPNAFRLIVVDEADLATPKAKALWLSAIENLPPRTVVVFTTNHRDSFAQRDLDRFQMGFHFQTNDPAAAQILSDRIWQAETGAEDGPEIERLPNVLINGQASYRRVAMALQAAVRDGAPAQTKPTPSFSVGTSGRSATLRIAV